MARATTKNDLLLMAKEQFDKFWKLIDSIKENPQTLIFNFGNGFNKKEAHWDRDKNLRDVYVHLYEWHQLLLNCVEANKGGSVKPFLPEPYNWKSYGKMNVGFWEKHQNTSYNDAKEMLLDSHSKVIELIETFSNEELFERKRFCLGGGSTLGSYCVSATSSHYDWAIKKIKQHIKNLK